MTCSLSPCTDRCPGRTGIAFSLLAHVHARALTRERLNVNTAPALHMYDVDGRQQFLYRPNYHYYLFHFIYCSSVAEPLSFVEFNQRALPRKERDASPTPRAAMVCANVRHQSVCGRRRVVPTSVRVSRHPVHDVHARARLFTSIDNNI